MTERRSQSRAAGVLPRLAGSAQRGLRCVLQALLPELCPRCRAPSEHGYCGACRGDFRPVADPCPRCALARPVAACPLADAGWAAARIVAPFAYEPPLLGQLTAFKYGGRRGLGRALGLLAAPAAREGVGPVDALVPVPLHAQRLRARRYNQADELAKTLARALGVRVLAGAVVRQVATAPQTELALPERRVNLRGAFVARGRLDGARIAIVDDVVTTGVTVNSLAEVLLGAGAAEVVALAVARTALPSGRAADAGAGAPSCGA